MEDACEVVREDIDYLTIGNTTYEIASIYTGKATLLDLVKASLERSAQQALRRLGSPWRGAVDEK
ncbi:MAG: hypothetical protein FWH26_01685 [Oscillospiraceae bacterium]|nr:hypothetical protein [Oscillospiraceae bacterium]